MKCPACNSDLKTIKTGTFEVDACINGCGGIWFDMQEIKGFDEPREFDLDKIVNDSGSLKAPTISFPRICPKCQEEVKLWRRAYGIVNEVQVDQCPDCSGIWLDHSELTQIRGQFDSEQDRNAAGDKMLAELQNNFYTPEQIEAWKQQLATSKEKTWGWFFSTMFGIGSGK